MNVRKGLSARSCVSALAFVLMTAPAHATFTAWICDSINCDGANTHMVMDNGAGDFGAGTAGLIISSFSFGGLTVLVNTSQSKPVIGSAASPQLDITFTITGKGNVYMYASDTDFTGIVALSGLFDGNRSGTSTVEEGIFGADNNTGPVPGAGFFLPVLAAGPVQGPGHGSFHDELTTGTIGDVTNPYRLMIGILVFSADGTTTGDFNAHSTPEPASLALLGIGLAALGFAKRRKQS